MFLHRFPTLVGTFIVSKFLGLLDRGWDVHVICKRSELAQWELFPQLQPRSELQSRVHATPDRDAVLKTLMVLRPDIIHFEHGFSALGRMYLKEVLGCKVVVSFRGSDLKVIRLEDPGCYKEVWDGADALHLCGQHLWEYAQHRGCPSDKFHVVIPGGIDAVFFDPMERRHPDMVGILERPIRIRSVGRLHWVKGYEYALQAVKLLVNQGIQCEYRIIGDGDHQPAVIFTILDLRLDNVVHLLGGATPFGSERQHVLGRCVSPRCRVRRILYRRLRSTGYGPARRLYRRRRTSRRCGRYGDGLHCAPPRSAGAGGKATYVVQKGRVETANERRDGVGWRPTFGWKTRSIVLSDRIASF